MKVNAPHMRNFPLSARWPPNSCRNRCSAEVGSSVPFSAVSRCSSCLLEHHVAEAAESPQHEQHQQPAARIEALPFPVSAVRTMRCDGTNTTSSCLEVAA
jgi:hypothetical protein